MDFEPGGDRVQTPGPAPGNISDLVTQVGDRVHIALDGGDLYLAWTTLAALEGADLLA